MVLKLHNKTGFSDNNVTENSKAITIYLRYLVYLFEKSIPFFLHLFLPSTETVPFISGTSSLSTRKIKLLIPDGIEFIRYRRFYSFLFPLRLERLWKPLFPRFWSSSLLIGRPYVLAYVLMSLCPFVLMYSHLPFVTGFFKNFFTVLPLALF